MRIPASCRHSSRRDNPGSDTPRVTIKKISFSPHKPNIVPRTGSRHGASSQRPADIRPGGTGLWHPHVERARALELLAPTGTGRARRYDRTAANRA